MHQVPFHPFAPTPVLHLEFPPEPVISPAEKLAFHLVFNDKDVTAPFPALATSKARVRVSLPVLDTPPESKIPKPKGEVGRSTNRGYSLSEEYKEDDYDIIHRRSKELVLQYLNLNAALRSQKRPAIETVHRILREEFPCVAEKYQNAWPIESFIAATFKTWRDAKRERKAVKDAKKKVGNQQAAEESELTEESELDETVGGSDARENEILVRRTTRSAGQTE